MNEPRFLIRNGEKVVSAVDTPGFKRPEDHRFFRFSENSLSGFNTRVAQEIMELITGKAESIKKMRKVAAKIKLHWTDNGGIGKTSVPLNYLVISEYVRKHKKMDFKAFMLPNYQCVWLDSSLDMSFNAHKYTADTDSVLTIRDANVTEQYGPNFPIHPTLDREGHIFSTLQPQMMKRVIRQRKRLIEEYLDPLHYDWVLELRSVINDAFSLLDMTLNQMYIKAEYDPLPGWTFNKEKLGERHGRRINDKVKWVRQIGGGILNFTQHEKSLNRIRELRNHLNHFDPPTLVITLEEAAIWLNDIVAIGMILLEIRKSLKVQPSEDLLNYLLQPEVVFSPIPIDEKRKPLDSKTGGYESSIW